MKKKKKMKIKTEHRKYINQMRSALGLDARTPLEILFPSKLSAKQTTEIKLDFWRKVANWKKENKKWSELASVRSVSQSVRV